MGLPVITTCPVCEQQLKVSKLTCGHCHTTIDNTFDLPQILSLKKEQLHFIETFILCRGSIKEVEKALGISYPTVRNKLEEVIGDLGGSVPIKPEKEEEKRNVIEQLSSGSISAEEAIKLLKKK
ncbi:hypothetical protein Q75_01990 [Bacillus coahuilensis p1.1.43]|uniref:DUF2089 domain-containing protein n=1 Tax=Bacillus coahuilensis p1.1.43 TaxID=1150625 RepID=A0A147KBN2_9BACI|nr:DUF2089 domain-containing protein [Bacillus coahuilensis]KUP08827.1 hypothetical protein Q75_01990 [Bacillus coahuilensis p1.1.43]